MMHKIYIIFLRHERIPMIFVGEINEIEFDAKDF